MGLRPREPTAVATEQTDQAGARESGLLLGFNSSYYIRETI